MYIAVKEHPELRREGISIHSDVEISYMDAILAHRWARTGACFCLAFVFRDLCTCVRRAYPQQWGICCWCSHMPPNQAQSAAFLCERRPPATVGVVAVLGRAVCGSTFLCETSLPATLGECLLLCSVLVWVMC